MDDQAAPMEGEGGADAPEAAAPAASAFRHPEAAFYEPVSAEAPAGEALEFYHFAEMDQELAWPLNEFGRPDREQRPNFRAVRDAAKGFLKGTKDLKATRDVRPLLALMIAEGGDRGPAGLAEGADLAVAVCLGMWEAVHPGKEDEDDDEMMTRMEEMRKYLSPAIIGMAVEPVTIARSQRAGELSSRTFAIASNAVKPVGDEFAPPADALRMMVLDDEEVAGEVARAHAAYCHAAERLRALQAFVDENDDLDPLEAGPVADRLQEMAGWLAPFADASGAASAPVAEAGGEAASGEAPAAPGETAAPAPRAAAPIPGPKDQDEAFALLDSVLAFYAERGRSSPVPLGLLAIRDLTERDFNAWIQSTASNGLSRAGLNLSQVDASRLSEFKGAGGGAGGGGAPADLSALDEPFGELDSAVDKLGYTAAKLPDPNAPAEEGAEAPPPVDPYTIEVLLEAVDKIKASFGALREAKEALSAGRAVDAGDGGGEAAGGDAGHSRITDRGDVKMALDAIAGYFEREEPSSPAPNYLRRLRGMVDARFADIARELMEEDGGDAKLKLETR